MKRSDPRGICVHAGTRMIRAVLFLVAVGSAVAQIRDAVYEDCGSTAEIISVQVEPCSSDPCVMKRGTRASLYFEIVADQDSNTAKLIATAKVFGIDLQVPGFKSNMCDGIVKCPIVKGQNYKGKISMTLPTIAPMGEVPLTVKVKGDKGVSVCATAKLILE